MNVYLEGEVTQEEVWNAAFQLGGNRARRPDGFWGMLYQRNWHIVGPDVFTVIKSLFWSCLINSTLNQTNITLIPEVPSLTRAVDFRLISLCNFVYNRISKVLVNRVKVYLSDLITPYQSAFVAGRMIQDNILVAV